ncbi:hypothetical protein FFWV33_11965 [Flavobacterium faecale]|uniref:Inner membrane protein YgaP-like transmembrane domain-containing protein n=1 Tax=Flavobacterium faecale TaxID=1355330 RepID=A0A2S1LEM0_9FLAO|nr:DUF2892 domain-containing protein [Flavobacterium faecale]AWG22177.1 hypothetical protein FFWV33_11965 [Flavobacterium faecale]
MKKNMGTTDKIIRLIIAVVISGLYFTDIISGTLSLILIAVAVVFIATSFISFCPLYAPFKINTGKK